MNLLAQTDALKHKVLNNTNYRGLIQEAKKQGQLAHRRLDISLVPRSVAWSSAVSGGAQPSVKAETISADRAETKAEVRRVSVPQAIGPAGGMERLGHGVARGDVHEFNGCFEFRPQFLSETNSGVVSESSEVVSTATSGGGLDRCWEVGDPGRRFGRLPPVPPQTEPGCPRLLPPNTVHRPAQSRVRLPRRYRGEHAEGVHFDMRDW